MATNNRYPVSVVMDLSATASIPQDRSMVTWNGRRFIIEPFTSPHTVFNGSIYLTTQIDSGYIGINEILVGHSSYHGFNYPYWNDGGNYVTVPTSSPTLGISNINCALPIPYDIESDDKIQIKCNLAIDGGSETAEYIIYLMKYFDTCRADVPIAVTYSSVSGVSTYIAESNYTQCTDVMMTGITYSVANSDMIGFGIEVIEVGGTVNYIKFSYILNIFKKAPPLL